MNSIISNIHLLSNHILYVYLFDLIINIMIIVDLFLITNRHQFVIGFYLILVDTNWIQLESLGVELHHFHQLYGCFDRPHPIFHLIINIYLITYHVKQEIGLLQKIIYFFIRSTVTNLVRFTFLDSNSQSLLIL